MNLHKFQEKANRLLYLYHSALKTIMNSNSGGDAVANNEDSIEYFTQEIKICMDELMGMLNGDDDVIEERSEGDLIIEDGKKFVEDALYFIDRILES